MNAVEVTTPLVGASASAFRSESDASLLCVLVGKGRGTVGLTLTTAEAVALIAALITDGEVHKAWLHGGGR